MGLKNWCSPPPPMSSALPRYFYTEAEKLRLTSHTMWQIFFISDGVCELLLSTANCARMGCSTSALKRLAAPVLSPAAHSAGLLSLLLVLPCLLAVFLMCLLCLLSLPLSSCFMVSPRKKYSFRSVILNVAKDKNSHHHIQPFVHSPFAAGFIF